MVRWWQAGAASAVWQRAVWQRTLAFQKLCHYWSRWWQPYWKDKMQGLQECWCSAQRWRTWISAVMIISEMRGQRGIGVLGQCAALAHLWVTLISAAIRSEIRSSSRFVAWPSVAPLSRFLSLYIHTHTHIHTYKHAYIHICMYVCMHECIWSPSHTLCLAEGERRLLKPLATAGG